MEAHAIENAITVHQLDLLVVPPLRDAHSAGSAWQPGPPTAILEEEGVAVVSG